MRGQPWGGRVFKIGIKNETGFVAKNASTNGGDASRVGIEKGGMIRTLLNNSCIFSDAGRVAPISGSGFCPQKRAHSRFVVNHLAHQSIVWHKYE